MFKACSLIYHDVLDDAAPRISGFSGSSAPQYTIAADRFKAHIQAISEKTECAPITVAELRHYSGGRIPFMLTFDDGGISAYDPVSRILDNCSWKAHFFVSTDFIGSPAFMSREQIKDLWEKGHVIGSHSCSHPDFMSACDENFLFNEWKRSIEILSDITGADIKSASIPGGYYSEKVASTAAAAGITYLFTSEPTTKCFHVGECLVIGRYSIPGGMAPREAACIAGLGFAPRMKQAVTWKLKGAAKKACNPLYIRLRKMLLKKKG